MRQIGLCWQSYSSAPFAFAVDDPQSPVYGVEWLHLLEKRGRTLAVGGSTYAVGFGLQPRPSHGLELVLLCVPLNSQSLERS
jgi:hypothetical protein